ncbi:type VI secretion system protein TssA [Citrobacter amalonaticus]|uniref:type VI secretion system protein TssA n=1 Tax=Citrobacter amalonaticus TaxID=35703 RepID=UPI0031F2E82C
MTMDLRNPDVWFAHLLENLPEEKLSAPLADDNPRWEFIDGEIVKLGSLAHSQLNVPELQRQCLMLLASESKDFRLVAHLLRTLQHAGDALLASRLLTKYVAHYWTAAAPQNMVHKKRFAAQVIKRFESGADTFSQQASTEQRDLMLSELAKLAQLWQEHNAPELVQAADDIITLYQRTFHDSLPAATPASTSPATTTTTQFAETATSVASPAPMFSIDSHDDKAWRETLLKVAAIFCERQPDSPLGYRLRRHALWQAITSAPQAESDGRTPLAAFPTDMMDDYLARLNNSDMALWQQVEKSLLLAPYWLDGHYLSAQVAQRLGYNGVAEAIRDEVTAFITRLPQLSTLLFNDHTPFMTEPTKRWLASPQDRLTDPIVQADADEEVRKARQCFSEQGLEAALQYLETLPVGSPRSQFYRQFLGAQLMEEAGMMQFAQQQYQMLFRTGLQIKLADWEPSLLEQLKNKFTAGQ